MGWVPVEVAAICWRGHRDPALWSPVVDETDECSPTSRYGRADWQPLGWILRTRRRPLLRSTVEHQPLAVLAWLPASSMRHERGSLALPLEREAPIGIEPCGQGCGRVSGHHEVVDVVARIPVGCAVRPDDTQRLSAEELSERLTGGHKANEWPPRAREADTSVSIDQAAQVVLDAEQTRRWRHRRRLASSRKSEFNELIAECEVAHCPREWTSSRLLNEWSTASSRSDSSIVRRPRWRVPS